VYYFVVFRILYFSVSRGCSAGSQIFFLVKTFETNQKNFCSRKITALLEISDFRKITTYMSYIAHYPTHFVENSRVFNFLCFGFSRGCSAGSQIFFLDKKSEMNQKNLCSGKIKALWKTSDFLKPTIFCHILYIYSPLSRVISLFFKFCTLV